MKNLLQSYLFWMSTIVVLFVVSCELDDDLSTAHDDHGITVLPFEFESKTLHGASLKDYSVFVSNRINEINNLSLHKNTTSATVDIDTTNIQVLESTNFTAYVFRLKDSISSYDEPKNYLLFNIADTVMLQYMVHYKLDVSRKIDTTLTTINPVYGNDLLGQVNFKCGNALETAWVGETSYEQSCYSGLHTIADGSECNYWGDPDKMARTVTVAGYWTITANNPADPCAGVPVSNNGGGNGAGASGDNTDQLTPYEDIDTIDIGFVPNIIVHTTNELVVKHIDDFELDDCRKEILNDLKNLSENGIVEIIDRLDGSDTPYNLKIRSVDFGNPFYRVLTNWKKDQNNQPIPYNYLITLNSNPASATSLSIATTILHELVHAHFLSLADDYLQTGDPTLQDDFPALWDWYVQNRYNGNAGVVQHNQMANEYVDILARALQEYHTGIPVLANTVPLELYSDLAWGGLQGTTAWNNSLTATDRSRIEGRKHAEVYNMAQYNPQGILQYYPQSQPCD